MLSQHLLNSFLRVFEHQPTENQYVFFEKFADFVIQENPKKLFLLTGYAGTGKTSAVSAIIKSLKNLKINSVLMAPTGRAAKVFTKYSQQTAYTIHKKIYRQRSSADGFGSFALDRNLHKDTLFIVDEASMISVFSGDSSLFGSGNLLEDLVEYVYSGKNCQLVLIGDDAQLPPVGIDESPALDEANLRAMSLDVTKSNLTMVVRQSASSCILENATSLRTKIANSMFFNDIPKFVQGIRNSILYRDSRISVGDYIMVVKNNYFWTEKVEELGFIANGDIAEILKIYGYQDLYGFKFADVCISLIDYNLELDVKILLDAIDSETSSLSREDSQRLFSTIMEDYAELNSQKEKVKKVKENEFFNALQVKFSYSITCHKAQGGQWQVVFLDQGYITEEMINKEYLRWMYTAFTRASDKIYLVNFADKWLQKIKS